MKQRLYVSPSNTRKGAYSNKYVARQKACLSRHFEILDSANEPCFSQSTALLKHVFKADVLLLNFLETIGWQPFALAQYLVVRLALALFRGRIVFVVHNLRPHKGENFMTRSLTRIQFRKADLILAHSRAAEEFAREQLKAIGRDASIVRYLCHPVAVEPEMLTGEATESFDLLIWGNILPYKGVLEFVNTPEIHDSGLKIKIIGACKDDALASAIAARATENISFERRSAGFSELSALIAGSRYVVFPYRTSSVSSSGVLIDTICMGGTCIGPDAGAFRDLADEGMCLTYGSLKEIPGIVASGAAIPADRRQQFITENSWENFADAVRGGL